MLISILVFPVDSKELLPAFMCVCNIDFAVDNLLEFGFSQSSISRIHSLSKYSVMNIYSSEAIYKAFITRIE